MRRCCRAFHCFLLVASVFTLSARIKSKQCAKTEFLCRSRRKPLICKQIERGTFQSALTTGRLFSEPNG